MIDIKPNLAEAVAFAVSLPTDQAHSRRQIPDKPPRCDG